MGAMTENEEVFSENLALMPLMKPEEKFFVKAKDLILILAYL